MATNRPRFMISVDDETFQFIEEYWHRNHFATRSAALQSIISQGIYALERSEEIERAAGTVDPDSPYYDKELADVIAADKENEALNKVLEEFSESMSRLSAEYYEKIRQANAEAEAKKENKEKETEE